MRDLIALREIHVARLKRANDSHLYILAGQSQGTWQVSEKGEVWLQQHSYPIPEQDEFVHLEPGTFRYLRDRAYIYIHGIQYEHTRQDISPGSQTEPIVEGLPLLLRLKENKKPAWDLFLDLAELSEDAWKELRSHSADLVTVSGTLTSISQKQLLHAPCYLPVFPRSQLYQVYREDNGHIKQVVKSYGGNLS